MKVAFIIQRYGREVVGGAETLCRAIAQRLADRWTVEVLTTCAVDHMTWANQLPPGPTTVDGVTVHRFPVDHPRNVPRFNRHSERVLMQYHTFEDELLWMELQGPKSAALRQHLAAHVGDYDGFVVFNYLYATTYDSIGQLGGRFYLVPFAHDEPPIYLRLFEQVFRSPRGVAFCTNAERDFVRQRFPFALPRSVVIGIGVDPPAQADAERFRAKYGIREPFLLYLGRIDESKGCDALLRDFAGYRARSGRSPRALDLVLCGSSQLTIPPRDDIHFLGFIEEQDKWDALAAARCLVLPSRFESLSIVLLEAWATGTPVLVDGQCAVSVEQCRRSGGGIAYSQERGEFPVALDWLAGDDALCARLGDSGRQFVERHYRWPTIIECYLDFLRF